MGNVLNKFWNVILGKANQAVNSLEEKSVVAQQSYDVMKENLEKMKIAVATLEAKVLVQEDKTSKLNLALSTNDQKIDIETAKYTKMADGVEKTNQKTLIESYLKQHQTILDNYNTANLSYKTQKTALDKLKLEINDLSTQLEEAKFAVSEIQINDQINQVKGTVTGQTGFKNASQKIKELNGQVHEQTLATAAYDNLGKTEEELIIAEHEKTQVSLDISDEFAKRLAKAQKVE